MVRPACRTGSPAGNPANPLACPPALGHGAAMRFSPGSFPLRFGLAFVLAWVAGPGRAAEKAHRDFRAEAAAAYGKKDYAAALAATQAALALRPDSPRYLYNLAAMHALLGARDEALRALGRLAALGVYLPAETDKDFASLQGEAEFRRLVQQLQAHREPQGTADVVGELPGRTGILEGLAFRPRTGDLFLGDVHHRCIWRRDRDGQIHRFSAEDEELFGCFALAIDEARNTLWAVTTATPEMAGYTAEMKGTTGVAEFNLATSELRRVVFLPGDGRDHFLGDLLLLEDGSVIATDSRAPVLWRLPAGAEEWIKVAESPAFASLQGVAAWRRDLVVSDYSNGLFVVDPVRGSVRPLAAPSGTTLLGLDGLVALPDSLVAIQNGVVPQRVLRLTLDPAAETITSVQVLAAGLPHLTDLALITLVNELPTFIAGSGWDLFDPAKAKAPPAHTVRIFQLPPSAPLP